MENKIYLIKDLAFISGFSDHTIKFYLKRGLIHEAGRSPQTKFRYFDQKTVDDLRRIKEYRKEQLSLNKISVLMREKEENELLRSA